ncbi:MAG: hypothetical protein UW35_C0030G0005 [Candidatus Collierbacteria bacterium GW2011_GWF2_44_15]|uniref:Uncharacterized protein n=1 Tax=Candidatus Collierbacteria bacterium GW2011_GWF2_44_15 TaxID=1618404 RepID=A0A0G1JPC8_9BACT|nr:MAG: hypothetical protein UW35_C0030G0005 [Candidatus Collierbacteria bacterium GW2011_GWF2_44_15]
MLSTAVNKMIINDYSQITEDSVNTSFKDVLLAGAVVVLPILFLLLISSQ